MQYRKRIAGERSQGVVQPVDAAAADGEDAPGTVGAVVKTSPRYRRASDRHSRGAVRPPRDFAVTKSRPPHDSVSVSSRRRRGVVTLSLRRSRRRDQYRQVAHDASNAAETQFRDRERRLSVSAAPSFLSRLPSAGAGEPLPTKLLSNGSVAACVAVPACSLAPGETQT